MFGRVGDCIVGDWRTAFLRMLCNREQLTPRRIISDTFGTVTTRDLFEAFYPAAVSPQHRHDRALKAMLREINAAR